MTVFVELLSVNDETRRPVCQRFWYYSYGSQILFFYRYEYWEQDKSLFVSPFIPGKVTIDLPVGISISYDGNRGYEYHTNLTRGTANKK